MIHKPHYLTRNRVSELTHLRVDDVDRKKGVITVLGKGSLLDYQSMEMISLEETFGGRGAAERVADYPTILWMVVFGISFVLWWRAGPDRKELPSM